MIQQLRTAILVLFILTIITGGIYPLVVTVIAQVAFPAQANGSFIRQGDQVVGSELIGQPFSRPEYFWGRLSATGPVPYNAAASSGSNFGPLHSGLKNAAVARLAALHSAGSAGKHVPVDLVTSSGSGLDPHISPAAAVYQIPRIAAARNLPERTVQELLQKHTDPRTWGLLGEPRVHVLRLNLALDALSPPPSSS
jgi:potassium-transporting ATPase KdpC subunit